MTHAAAPHAAADFDAARSVVRLCPSRAVAALLMLLALQGCGGGGGSPEPAQAAPAAAAPAPAPAPSAPAPAPVPQTVLSGQVVAVGVPVTVSVALVNPAAPTQTIKLTDTVDSSDKFSLSVPTAAIPKNAQVAIVITAAGHLPTTVIYSTSATGEPTPVSATNALGSIPATGAIVLAPINYNLFAFPGFEQLNRLGDGNISNTASFNSKLQLPAPPNDKPVTTLASGHVPYPNTGKTQLTVQLQVRGLEPVDCPGSQAVLRNLANGGSELARQVQALGASPIDGSFGLQALVFTLDPLLLAGSDFVLEITTGFCAANDYDDMEFVNVTGTLN